MNKEKQHNKLVPALRFPEFEGDGDWEEITIGGIADIITGTTPKTSEPKYYDGEKLFASPADISENRYIDKTNKTLSQLGFSKSRVIPENSILFVCIGSTIGKIAQNRIECTTNQQINSLIPFKNHSNDFIYSLLENNSSKIASLAGHQAVPLINKTDFSAILICIPPSKLEQQKIANCLSSLDNVITAEIEKLDHLKNHKKGLLQQLFPAKGETKPQFRFPEFKNDGDWEEKSFQELFTIGNGRDYKHLLEGDVPVYGSGGYMRSVNEYLYDGESVCIGRKGTIDKPRYLSGKFWTVDTLFYTHSFNDCIPKFIYLIFQKINWLLHNEAGGVPSLSKTNLNKINVQIPLPNEQEKIVYCFNSIDDLVQSQTTKIEALKAHKKGLMQQLFPNVNSLVI